MAPGVVAAITSRVNDKFIGTDKDGVGGGKYRRLMAKHSSRSWVEDSA